MCPRSEIFVLSSIRFPRGNYQLIVPRQKHSIVLNSLKIVNEAQPNGLSLIENEVEQSFPTILVENLKDCSLKPTILCCFSGEKKKIENKSDSRILNRIRWSFHLNDDAFSSNHIGRLKSLRSTITSFSGELTAGSVH